MSSRFILPFADVGSGIKPSSGAKLFFFETDGVTPKDTFSDQLATPTPNTNPVVADSNGAFGDIYIVGKYKVTLEDKNGSQIFGGAVVEELVTGSGQAENVLSRDTLDIAIADTSLSDGLTLNIKERSTGNGGGAVWDAVLASTVTPNTYNIVQCVGAPTLALVLRTGDTIIGTQWGVVASSTPLSSDAALQAVFDAAQNKQLILPVSPPCWTSTPIKLRTGTKILRGNIKANDLESFDMNSFQQPNDPESYGAITVDRPPILYNPTPIQWWEIHNLWLDGNSEDVHSHILYGAFYGLQEKVVAYRCLAGAFNEIRTQVVHHDQCVAYQCGNTVMFNWTNLTFTCCGFERTKNATVAVDLRQPVGFNKGGCIFDDCWFEDEVEDGGGVDGAPPSAGYLRVAGRNCSSQSLTFSTSNTSPIRAIWGMPSGNALTKFGVDMASAPCIGGEFDINIASANLFPEFSTGSNNNKLQGFWTASLGIDSGEGNNWNNQGDGLNFNKLTNRLQVRRSHTSISSNDYVVDIDENGGNNIIRLFGNSNNNIQSNSGILEYHSNSIMRFISGDSVSFQPATTKDIQFVVSGGGNLAMLGIPTSSAGLNSGDVWNDSGTLKIIT